MCTTLEATTGERALMGAVKAMLGDRGYLFPLAAAQRQFRDAYYGMSAAALLEDLFFDAMNNYLHQFRPGQSLTRPQRGQRGWDYALDGTLVSHKVGKGPTQIAALWDATKTQVDTWSFESSILFTSSDYSRRSVRMGPTPGRTVRLQPLIGIRDESIQNGDALLVVRWPPGVEAKVVHFWIAAEEGLPRELLPLPSLWSSISQSLSEAPLANEIEVFVLRSRDVAAAQRMLGRHDAETRIELRPDGLRPGQYLFPRSSLQEVHVTRNNRALLVSRSTVADLMEKTASVGLFAPLPTWFAAWAPTHPPDLYLTQRAQFDQLFSYRS